MGVDGPSVRALVIQLWTMDLDPIASALEAAGIAAAITRVDFEAALNAVLAHERFDLAIYDPGTPNLSRETVEACFRAAGREVPIVVIEPGQDLAACVRQLLAVRRN